MTRPLEGCRVLDLGIITAGAATGALLADLGAEVVKVESPGYRDPFRAWTSIDRDCPPDLPAFFRYTNRNKTGISLDLKRPEGRDAFLRLAARSDVVLENFRRGAMDRLGLGYEALRAANGSVIYASLSSQGDTGPDASYVSYGTTLEAMAGLASLTGYADGTPVVSGKDLNYPDQVAALFGAGMIVTAWLRRQRTGAGAHLDMSQRELTSFLIGETLLHPELQERTGNAEPGFVLQGCFAATDGWLAVSVEAERAGALEQLLPAGDGSPEERLRAWIAAGTREGAASRLAAAGIAAAPALDGGEVLAGRGAWWDFAIAADAGGRLFKGFPFQFADAPMRIARDAPRVGADTVEVLREIGGYSAQEIEALLRDGVAERAAGVGQP